MKKLFAFITFFGISVASMAQESDLLYINRHEVGVDATSLLERFLFGSGSSFHTPYNLTYRYHFENWALRAGVGGFVNSENTIENDSLDHKDERSYLEMRLGAERKVNFARRWQFFYGLDLWAATQTTLYYNEYTTTENRRIESYENRFGISPMLGLRFKINDRMSVSTEANWLFYYMERQTKNNYEPTDEYDYVSESDGYSSQFTPPVSVFFNFNLNKKD